MPDPGPASGWPDAPGDSRAAGTGRTNYGVIVAACVLLFVLGGVQGVIGAFFYAGPPSGLAVGFDVLICATCLLGGWGLRGSAGAFTPAAGWLLAAFFLAKATSGGSVLITNTGAGELFLFGGAVAAAMGAVGAALIWSRPAYARSGRRTGGSRPPGGPPGLRAHGAGRPGSLRGRLRAPAGLRGAARRPGGQSSEP